MAKKRKIEPKKRDPNSLALVPKDADMDEFTAKLAIDPSAQSAMTVKMFGADKGFQNTDLTYLAETLSNQIEAANSNDLTELEGMLTGQAYALNAMFNNLTQKAIGNMGYDMEVADKFLKFGLRAQSQCRAIIEAISTVKNPPVTGYVRQANITQGPQQINNGIEQGKPSRAGENQNPKNELLEKKDGKQLDTGTQSQAISDDSAMETVGKVNGAKNARG
jgi:hypothetical protein